MTRLCRILSLPTTLSALTVLGAVFGCSSEAPILLVRGGSGGAQAAAVGTGGTATSGGAPGVGGALSTGGDAALPGTGGAADLVVACTTDAECTTPDTMCDLALGQCVAVVAAAGGADPGGSGGDAGSGGDLGSGGDPGSGGDAGSGGAGTGGAEPVDDTLITNGDFSQTNTGINTKDDNPNGDGYLGWRGGDDKVDHTVADMGCVNWDAVIGWDGGTGGVALEEGSYTLTFKVITSGGGEPTLELKVAGTSEPFEPNLYDQAAITVSSDANETKTINFSVSADDAGQKVGLAFFVGGVGEAQLCLDDVLLEKN